MARAVEGPLTASCPASVLQLHLHATQTERVTAALRSRPDAVLIGLGLGEDAALAASAAGPGARWALVWSASRVSVEAVAARLV